MADTKISGLSALTSLATGDLLALVDVSDTTMAASGTDKKVTLSTLRTWLNLPTIVRKTSDETVNNSNTLQDDNELLVAVEASTVYRVELNLLTTAANATADWKFGFTGPASATMQWGAIAGGGTADWAGQGTGTNQKTLTDIATALSIGSAGVTGGFILVGILVTAGTAGNLQFQWAQNTANSSDSKVLTNSTLMLQKVS